MSLTIEQHQTLDHTCNNLLQEPSVRFCGIINHLGRLVAGGFRDGIEPYENAQKQRIMFMELVLETKMRKEYDNTLGRLEYTVSRRDKVVIITMPLNEQLVVISAEIHSDAQRIAKIAKEQFQYCSLAIVA